MAVEFWTVITQINEVLGVYETLKSFVHNEMAELMIRMGEIEFKAAVESLHDIKTIDKRLSEAKKDELRDKYISNAIIALKMAHGRFVDSIPKGLRQFFWSAYDAQNTYEKMCRALVLQATCFGALEDWTNAAIQFEKAVLVFEKYAKPAFQYWEARALEPSVHDKYLKRPSKEEQLKELERIDRLRRKLKDLEAKARR